MPYIKQDRREAITAYSIQNVGELNYFVTMKCLEYLKEKGESYKTYLEIFSYLEEIKHQMQHPEEEDAKILPPCFHFARVALKNRVPNSDAIATVELVKAELYRRRIAPYEEKKIAENGDVF